MKLSSDHIKRLTYFLFATMLAVLFLYVLKDVLVPLVYAALFAFMLFPIYKKLISWKVPSLLAAGICILLLMSIFVSLGAVIFWQAGNFLTDVSTMKIEIYKNLDRLLEYIEQQTRFSKNDQIEFFKSRFSDGAGAASIYVISIFALTAAFLTSAVLIPIYIFLFLIYHTKFETFLLMVITDEQRQGDMRKIMTNVSHVGNKFIKGTLLDVLIISALSAIGFLLIGLKQAILLGILVAVLNVIPYVGAIIGALIPVMLGLLTTGDWRIAASALGVCLVVQFIDNNFVMPKVVGSSVSINPLFSTVALLLGYMLWGISGMILSIPLMGVLKIFCDNVSPLQPWGYIMGEKE
ncbi:MAG: AI-2E family transporter [Chitinophagales bacterium]